MSVSLNISLRNGKKVIKKTKKANDQESNEHDSDEQSSEELETLDESVGTLYEKPESVNELETSEKYSGENFSTPDSQKKKHISSIMSTFNVSHAIKLIPEFDGSPSTLTRFLQIAKIHHSKAADNSEKAEFLDLIKSKLTGKAYNVLLRYNDYENWSELEVAINKHFTKFRSVQVIQAELFTIRQGPRETVSEYAERIERLLDELNISSTQGEGSEGSKAIRKLNEKTAINNFKRGLKTPLKLIVKSTKHDTLPSAIEYALEEEHISESEIVKDTIRCNFCKIVGHSTNDCRKLRNQTTPVQPNRDNRPAFPRFPNPRVNTIQNVQQCRYCKNMGHSIQDCRKRQYNNTRRQYPIAENTISNTNSNRPNANNFQSRSNDGLIRRTNSGNASEPGRSGAVVRAEHLS